MADRTPALDLVYDLVRLLGADMRRALAREGLTTSRAALLWHLDQRGLSTQRALADALGVSPRNVTGLVDVLEATGFVRRAPHPHDRRATLVTFTDHGGRVAAGLSRGKDELAGVLFGDMAPERYDCFLAGLTEVLTALRERGLADGAGR